MKQQALDTSTLSNHNNNFFFSGVVTRGWMEEAVCSTQQLQEAANIEATLYFVKP